MLVKKYLQRNTLFEIIHRIVEIYNGRSFFDVFVMFLKNDIKYKARKNVGNWVWI